jgi:hypothetical protein
LALSAWACDLACASVDAWRSSALRASSIFLIAIVRASPAV